MWACLAVLGATTTASAVCLDENFVSGYHLPLEREVHSAVAIVLGKVTRKKDLVEDPAYPDGITATIYTGFVRKMTQGGFGWTWAKSIYCSYPRMCTTGCLLSIAVEILGLHLIG
jgi:hypothetical protein